MISKKLQASISNLKIENCENLIIFKMAIIYITAGTSGFHSLFVNDKENVTNRYFSSSTENLTIGKKNHGGGISVKIYQNLLFLCLPVGSSVKAGWWRFL